MPPCGCHHCITHFVGQTFAAERNAVTRTLKAMHDNHLERARAVPSVVGARR